MRVVFEVRAQNRMVSHLHIHNATFQPLETKKVEPHAVDERLLPRKNKHDRRAE
jgi:hypothetical protein